jgi:hypothetical protein
MVAFALFCLVVLVDPVLQVQLRYPSHRTTITTASGYVVSYSVPLDTPPELWRAYKALEAAEREVLITEALQLLKLELVQNERRLEALRTARLAAYLTDSRGGPQYAFVDPALIAPPESRLKFCVSEILASDAKIERGLAALDRFVEAHYQLRQTLIAIAYPDRRPAVAAVCPVATAPAVPAAAAVRMATALAEAERAEKAAADAETAAEERERNARQVEIAAEARYRDSLPADRAAIKAEWLKARDAWEQARREWDESRDQWKAARERLSTARSAIRPATPSVSSTAAKPANPPR